MAPASWAARVIVSTSSRTPLRKRTWLSSTTATRLSIAWSTVSVGRVIPSQLRTVRTSAAGTECQTYPTVGKSRSAITTRPLGGRRSRQEAMTASAMVTLGTMAIDPGGAPTSGASRSPTRSGASHQPSSQARTPRVAHCSAYCSIPVLASIGIAPSEWLTR